MKSDIPFIQYKRPDGRQVPVSINRPQPISALAAVILGAGYRFETEILMDGLVSFTVFDPRTEEDVAIEVCKNGPEVPKTVDRLIEEFAKRLESNDVRES